jgi:hypothetical protein
MRDNVSVHRTMNIDAARETRTFFYPFYMLSIAPALCVKYRPERRSGTNVLVMKLCPLPYKLVLHGGWTTARVRGFLVEMGELVNADFCLWLETNVRTILPSPSYNMYLTDWLL